MTKPRGFPWHDWGLVDGILARALELDPSGRADFLRASCADRPDLLPILEELAVASQRPDPRLEALSASSMESALAEWAPSSRALSPGQIVGRYRVVREIDRGGMATVYEVERVDGVYRRRVALKILRRGLDTDDIVRRFHAEREILSSLVHPNIAHILDGGSTEDGRPYLVMELVDGRPITEWASSREIGLAARIRLFLDVAGAIAFAHGQLVIHRDIKPSNVLVGEDGQAKLLDFGIAKILRSDAADAEVTCDVPLTPAYASPEQARGERMSTASDVYQLGVLLFELLTDGGHASDGDDTAPGSARLDGLVPSRVAAAKGLRRLATALRGDLDTIVEKATRQDPDERYRSVEALISDLQAYLHGRPIAARPATLAYRARKLLARNRWLAPTAGIVAVLTAGYMVVLSAQAHRLEVERDRARALAERSGALRELLVGQLGAANPWGADPRGARDITVVRALGPVTERAREELAGEPVLLAGILSDVAAVYENVDAREPAMELLGEAIDLREHSGAGWSEDQRDDLGLLSTLLSRHSLPDSARALAERRLRMERAAAAPDDERVAIALGGLARLETSRGRDVRADTLFTEGLRLLRARNGDPSVLAGHLEGHATTKMKLAELEAAESALREALTIRRGLVEEDHPGIAVAESLLAAVFFSAGRLEESAALYARALGKMDASLGPHHSTTVATLNNLGLVLNALEDFEGAVEIHRRLLARAVAAAPKGMSHEAATSLQNLAAALIHLGELEEADSLSARAGEIFAFVNGDAHYTVGFTLLTRTEVALLRGDGARATALATMAVALLSDALPDGHYATAVATCRRAAGWLLMDRPRDAEPLARTSFETLRASALASDRRVGECGDVLQRIYGRLDRAADAARIRHLVAEEANVGGS